MNFVRQVLKYHTYDPQSPNSLTCQSVRSIVEDDNGLLWIGTQTGGINTFDPITEQFKPVGDKQYIIDIYKDRSGDLWFGTMRGLIRFDRESGKYLTYRHNPEDSTSLSHRDVQSMYESKSGEFWVGTVNSGLNLFDRKSGKFIHYTTKNGLPNNFIGGILEDELGNLWISTTKAISKFNPKTKEFKNYDHHDGLLSGEYTELSYFRNKDGEMFFGNTAGLNIFFPDDIHDNNFIPPIVITNFRIFNKPVAINQDEIAESQSDYVLPGHISTLNELKLSYRESIFSFEFAALDFHSPQKNQYAYKMEGVDPDWVITDASRRFATYTNLDPGAYTFVVKGSNNNGVWNEEGTSIRIIITPPWWRSNLAYAFYIILCLSIVFITWRMQLRRVHIKQQLKMEHFEAEKLRDVDQLKSRFFANISHEFRTPLTLIKGPVKQIMDGTFTGNLKQHCQMILRNSDRLVGLINQILDLSRLESGEMKLKVTETNIDNYLHELVISFTSLAERKDIMLTYDSKDRNVLGYVDPDKLEKIVTNLLSNAFKFTPEGGKITVECGIQPIEKSNIQNPKSKVLFLNVNNTGSGIPEDQLDKIFDRFYQADNNYKKDGEGTGIGLALTKELVEVCRGEISVSSIQGESTTFTIKLPIAKENFKEDEIREKMETKNRGSETGILMTQESTDLKISQPDRFPDSRLPSPLLLIVEDNPDVVSYIFSFMEKEYHLITAENGKVGLEEALDKYPDLVISDVMMPEMDGFELCQKIKSDERISHIPVILLTAKADLYSRIEGLEYGADDYINKPFESAELMIRVKNLIAQRKRLREKFSRMIETNPNEITATSMDEQFLRRLLNVFEDHVAQSDFSTEDFAREVGMSRSNLHLKIKALTNQPTHEFLRTLRLKRAAQLLQKSAGTVTEIAYAVGFNNPSYFSRIFRQQFGKTPSEFAQSD